MFENMGQYLTDGGWHFEAVPEEHAYVGTVDGDDMGWKVVVRAIEKMDLRRLYIASTLPNKVPSPKRLAVAELIARINYELVLCHWDLNMDEGMISVCTSIELADTHLTEAMFANNLDHNLSVVNVFANMFMIVIYGDGNPSDVYKAYQAQEEQLQGATLQ